MITTERLAELKRLAEAADETEIDTGWQQSGWSSYAEAVQYCGMDAQDFDYIAALNPQTALKLIGEIERLLAERAELVECVKLGVE